MTDRQDLREWVLSALISLGGEAQVVDVAKHIWQHHEAELRRAGDLFFTWQYDMRWAAKRLRDEGRLAAAEAYPRGTWAVVK